MRGTVVRNEDSQPILGATVSVPAFGRSTATDSLGRFELVIPDRGGDSLSDILIRVSALGFVGAEIAWLPARGTPTFRLERASEHLDEVLISQRVRYRNRGNPAVELIQQVIDHRADHRISNLPYLHYEAYEKIMMAASDLPRLITDNPLFRNYSFIFDNVDTNLVAGRELLPVYLEETLRQEYHGSRIGTSRFVTEATQKTELDKRFVNNENIQAIVAHLHTDMDVYANTILLLNRAFLSPIGTGAPLFYRYSIQDTVQLDTSGRSYIRVRFEPRNEEDRLFSGQLWVSADGTYAIRRAELAIGRRSNVNWVNDVRMQFEFLRHPSGHYLPAGMDAKINFGIYGSRQGMFSHWVRHYDKHRLAQRSTRHPEEAALHGVSDSAQRVQGRDFWDARRPLALSSAEAKTYRNVDSLQGNKSFLRTLSWASLALTSYKHVGPMEIGPLEYAYSFNDLEGNRVRVGGRTSREFSEKFYGETYAAYGFGDQRWKYYLGAAVTLKPGRIAAYPAHYLHITWQEDAREPGQRPDFLNGDSFFRSFRKSEQHNWLYHRLLNAHHVIEFGNHVRLQTTFTVHRRDPTRRLEFRRTDDQTLVTSLRTTEFSWDLRWAPNEEYFQRNLIRTPIVNKYPVFNLRYNAGVKGLLGGDYDYHAFRFDARKRWYIAMLGHTNVTLGAGYIRGVLPFPLLETPNANQSYLLAADSYSLMNDLEFVSDHYAKVQVGHHFEGFFLNKIPLLKRMKIRELVGFNMFWGGLRAENHPGNGQPGLFYFPSNEDGQATTFGFRRRPYLEVSAGLENIFNLIRIEYIRRLSYLDHPDADAGGLRFSFRIGF